MMNQGQVPSYKGRIQMRRNRKENSLRVTHKGGSDCSMNSSRLIPVLKTNKVGFWSGTMLLKILVVLPFMLGVNAMQGGQNMEKLFERLQPYKGVQPRVRTVTSSTIDSDEEVLPTNIPEKTNTQEFDGVWLQKATKMNWWGSYEQRNLKAHFVAGVLRYFSYGKNKKFYIKKIGKIEDCSYDIKEDVFDSVEGENKKQKRKIDCWQVLLTLSSMKKKGRALNRYLRLDSKSDLGSSAVRFLKMCYQYNVKSAFDPRSILEDRVNTYEEWDGHRGQNVTKQIFPKDASCPPKLGDYAYGAINRVGVYDPEQRNKKFNEIVINEHFSAKMVKNAFWQKLFGGEPCKDKTFFGVLTKSAGNLAYFKFNNGERFHIKLIGSPDNDGKVKLTFKSTKGNSTMRGRKIAANGNNPKTLEFLHFCRKYQVPSENNWLKNPKWYNKLTPTGPTKALIEADNTIVGYYLYAIKKNKVPNKMVPRGRSPMDGSIIPTRPQLPQLGNWTSVHSNNAYDMQGMEPMMDKYNQLQDKYTQTMPELMRKRSLTQDSLLGQGFTKSGSGYTPPRIPSSHDMSRPLSPSADFTSQAHSMGQLGGFSPSSPNKFKTPSIGQGSSIQTRTSKSTMGGAPDKTVTQPEEHKANEQQMKGGAVKKLIPGKDSGDHDNYAYEGKVMSVGQLKLLPTAIIEKQYGVKTINKKPENKIWDADKLKQLGFVKTDGDTGKPVITLFGAGFHLFNGMFCNANKEQVGRPWTAVKGETLMAVDIKKKIAVKITKDLNNGKVEAENVYETFEDKMNKTPKETVTYNKDQLQLLRPPMGVTPDNTTENNEIVTGVTIGQLIKDIQTNCQMYASIQLKEQVKNEKTGEMVGFRRLHQYGEGFEKFNDDKMSLEARKKDIITILQNLIPTNADPSDYYFVTMRNCTVNGVKSKPSWAAGILEDLPGVTHILDFGSAKFALCDKTGTQGINATYDEMGAIKDFKAYFDKTILPELKKKDIKKAQIVARFTGDFNKGEKEMHQKMWKTYLPILKKHCASVEKLLTQDEGRYGSAHCVSLVSSIQKSKYYVAVEVGQGTSEGWAFKTVEDRRRRLTSPIMSCEELLSMCRENGYDQ